ncbi:MAG: thioredoxin domain-containing protein [Patescibacteria group bacterium]
MEETEEINMLPVQTPPPAKHRWSPARLLGMFGFVVALFLVLGFSWRVFSFYRGIRDGSINPALAYTTTNFTRAVTAFAAKAATNTDSASLLGASDPSLGNKNAKITVVEFADFGCPYSQEVAPIVRAIAKQYPDDVRVVFRNYPLEELHSGATIAAQAGGCAAEQGKFWEYHDAVFASKEPLGVETLSGIADTLGLDSDQFARCLDSDYYANDVTADSSDGAAAGVTGTPTFFFNGQKVEGSIPFTIFTQILDAMRQT